LPRRSEGILFFLLRDTSRCVIQHYKVILNYCQHNYLLLLLGNLGPHEKLSIVTLLINSI
jgi:hypothetical protein